MELGKAKQAIQKEMNRRRRYGGAEDVPAALWEYGEVSAAVQRAAECARSEGFSGDWDEAPIPLEEQMEALARTLRRLSQQTAFDLATAGTAWRAGIAARMAQAGQSHFLDNEEEERGGMESRPATVRQDAGGQVLADYLTWYFRNDGAAQYYRERICGGEYLTREDAWVFLTSSLPKVMSYEDYEQLGLCPARAKGRILSKYLKLDGLLWVTNMLMVDPKTRVPTATIETLRGDWGQYCVEISLRETNGTSRKLKRMVLSRSEKSYLYVSHLYAMPRPYQVANWMNTGDVFCPPQPAPYFPNERRYVEGYSESVMGELISMADFFCERYPVTIWDMLEALLTGQFPPLSAVEIFPWRINAERFDGFDEFPKENNENPFTAQGPATLTVQPWVTPELLADAWREHRKANSCYSPSAKQAAAIQFVLSHTPPGQEFEWGKAGETMAGGARRVDDTGAALQAIPAGAGRDFAGVPGNQRGEIARRSESAGQ